MILTVVEITMLSLHSGIDGFHWFFFRRVRLLGGSKCGRSLSCRI